MKSHPRKITVLLDQGEFRRFNEFCSKQGFKKSTLLARLIREHLEKQGFGLQSEFPLSTKKDG